ncbi:MAG: response regulator [Bacteroidota bacterium]|nr:response regulator [Bacteroidota bacterium]
MADSNILKILLVDDEEPFRKVVGDFLNSTNLYVTYFCESGEEAIALISQNRFDVILLDYKMAGVSGLNVLQWMHEQKIDTPIIMLTAAGSENIAVEVMKFGAYDYIRKEQLQFEVLPILINSVYQQYLFRKEKENREFIQGELNMQIQEIGKIFEEIKAYQKTIHSSLSVISSELKRLEGRITPETTYQGSFELVNPIIPLNEYLTLISLAVNSIDDLLANQQNILLKRYIKIKEPEIFSKR